MNLIIGSLAVVMLSACGTKTPGMDPNAAKPYPVVIVPAKSVTGFLSYPTSIEGRVNNEVRAKISGYIKQVLVDEGQLVRKGQVLFRLETNTLSETASAARSAIGTADAGIKAAEAAVNAAQVEVNRLVPLVNQNIVSRVQLETAEANLHSAESLLAQAKAGKNQAHANYLSAAANVDYSIIRSPIDGVVGKLPLRIGSLVGPSDATPITTVSETSEVYAYFSMNEAEYLDFLDKTPGATLTEKLKNIPPVTLVLANDQEYNHKGYIKTVTGQIDPQTGTILFRATFPNPERLLTNGNSGTIKIPKFYNNVLVVPEASTFEQQGVVHVFKVNHDTVNSVIVGVLDRVDNMALINSGLQLGDTLVAAGTNSLRTGAKIIPRQANFDSLIHAIKPVFQND